MQPLTPIQTQVLSGLLAGQPIGAVARENGIDRSTIYHWRKDHPYFTFALDQARARLQTALYDDVQDLVSQALEVLAELLHSENVNIRLRVAQTLLRAANPMKANTILHTSEAGDRSRLPPSPPESDEIQHVSMPSPAPQPRTPSRNQRCPCNSGIKYKKCCGNPARPAANRGMSTAA